MDRNWVTVYRTEDRMRAELLKGYLESKGIDVIVLNKQDSAYLAFGEIELYVKRDDLVTAKYHVDQYE